MESEDDCGGGPLGDAGDDGRRPPEVTSDDGGRMGGMTTEGVSGQSLGYMVGFWKPCPIFHWAPV